MTLVPVEEEEETVAPGKRREEGLVAELGSRRLPK